MEKRWRVVALAFVLGCAGESSGPADGSMLPPMADGTVRAVVVGNSEGAGLTTITLLVESRSVELGAYQGRFTFDTRVMELREAIAPEPGYRVTNLERAAEGEIRFAGYTVDGFGGTVVLVLHFGNNRRVGPADVNVDLEVVGTLGGQEVPAGRILPSGKLFEESNR